MQWKKRMMTPPPDEGKSVEIITGGAASGTLNLDMKYTDQKNKITTQRGWDELSINEKCDRLGKWIGYLMNQMDKEEGI
jgi:hypothetical protein